MEEVKYERTNSLQSQGETERLEFFFSCRNLDDVDTVTVTDPFLVVKMKESDKQERIILKTKTVMNNLNPDFYETAIVVYEFEGKEWLT